MEPVSAASAIAAGRPSGGWSFIRRKRFLIVAIALALALAYIIFVGVQSASMYYLTPTEFQSRDAIAKTEQVRVGGKVDPNSIRAEAGNVLRFTVRDDSTSLPVVYRGVVPDAFKPDGDVVVEGRLSANGEVFEATQLIAKCPSKYIPKI